MFFFKSIMSILVVDNYSIIIFLVHFDSYCWRRFNNLCKAGLVSDILH